MKLPIKVEKYKLTYEGIKTIERKRLAGQVKVVYCIDGFKILYSTNELFFTKFSKNF